jgi:hypothetical protein
MRSARLPLAALLVFTLGACSGGSSGSSGGTGSGGGTDTDVGSTTAGSTGGGTGSGGSGGTTATTASSSASATASATDGTASTTDGTGSGGTTAGTASGGTTAGTNTAGTTGTTCEAGCTIPTMLAVTMDECGHEMFVDLGPTEDVVVTVDGFNITIEILGTPGLGPVVGSIDGNGNFTASGTATVAGYPNISVEWVGTFDGASITGTLTLGSDGNLPNGCPIVYAVT